MKVDFHVIIPARYASTRFPGKLLQKLGDYTVIERVYKQVLKAKPESVVIATDDERIADCAAEFGATVHMTSPEHTTGTDRIAEVVSTKHYPSEAVIVNVQGDEPFLDPQLITQVAQCLQESETAMATLCCKIDHYDQIYNPNVVKVVRDCQNNALYFSRNPIPAQRDGQINLTMVYRHIGLYAYRASFLLNYVRMPVCLLETCEALEQLRVLWAGYQIKVVEACRPPSQDINTEADLNLAKQLLKELCLEQN